MMSKEITITNASNQSKFISFKLNGLEDGIIVGIPDKYSNCITISYKGETKIVPFDANHKDLEESDKITTTLSMDKETYDWLTTPSEEDDVGYYPACCTELDKEAYEAFEKDVMNPKIDEERVEATKRIFEGVDEIPVDISSCIEMHSKPHLLELMDEWGVNGSNYIDFRSVIQEHCFDKGLYSFDDIEKSWKEHQESIKNAIKSIKKNG